MTLTIAIVTVILTFICTGVVANWLVQKWQYRNWLNQQRFLGSEKKYEALKAHADEISRIAATRLSAMFRLAFVLDQNPERIEDRRKIYSDAVDAWNQHINAFYFKTTMYFSWEMTGRLENDINASFVSAGARLDKLTRSALDNKPATAAEKSQILNRLYTIQGALGLFNRDMLRHVMKQHSSTYHGVVIKYNRTDLQYFTTWQLFKALFITRIEQFSVTLTAFELEAPASRED